ncbi:MAG: electron transport complex subunit E [Oscillospiraceae bacterium]|nr:electron transport complex subunit E [Oscillospiraceae bacterium]
MNRLSTLTNGLVKENPVLVSLLGICPVLAVSTQAANAIGMGLATTFVLLGANIAVALLRNVIPDKVRIPCYIVLVAGFVTLAQMVTEAYAYPLYLSLGIFLPLITTNCIILFRAEIFAKKNTVADSAIDALGMGAGFTLAMLAMASIREILGSGTWFGIPLPVLADDNISIFTMAPGGFVIFGILIAIVNKVSKGKAIKKKEFGCAGCPSAANCQKGGAA